MSRTRYARGGELRVAGAVLAAVRGGDEGTIAARPGEDDVARLVAHQQRAHHARRVGGDVDDADAVRQEVHDPDLVRGSCRHRHRLQAHGNRLAMRETIGRDVEDLQAIVGRVHREEPRPVGRQRKRANLPALEGDEVRACHV